MDLPFHVVIGLKLNEFLYLQTCLYSFYRSQGLMSHHNHHQFLLLLVERRASVKSFQTLRSPAVPLTSFYDLPVFLISSSVVLRHFSLAYLFFYIPEDSNPMQFSLFLLFLYAMCVLEQN